MCFFIRTRMVALFIQATLCWAAAAPLHLLQLSQNLEQLASAVKRDRSPQLLGATVPALSDQEYAKIQSALYDSKDAAAFLTKLESSYPKSIISELMMLILKELKQDTHLDWCLCHPLGLRMEYILRIVHDLTTNFPDRSQTITITSLASGSLLQDYITIKALISLGYTTIHLHAIDITYPDAWNYPTSQLAKEIAASEQAVIQLKYLLRDYAKITVAPFTNIYQYSRWMLNNNDRTTLLSMMDPDQDPEKYLKELGSKHNPPMTFPSFANTFVINGKEMIIYTPHYPPSSPHLYTKAAVPIWWPSYKKSRDTSLLYQKDNTVALTLDLYVAFFDLMRALLMPQGIAYYTQRTNRFPPNIIVKATDPTITIPDIIHNNLGAWGYHAAD